MNVRIDDVVFVCEDSKYGDMYPFFLADALELGAQLVRKVFQRDSCILNIIRKIAFSNKLNSICRNWMELFPVGKYRIEAILEQKNNATICFFNASLQRYYSGRKLNQLKKKYPDAHFILFYLDPMHMSSAFHATAFMQKYDSLFSLVYSIEKGDCEKFSLKQWCTLYSAESKKMTRDGSVSNDLYFCGVTKNRAEDIIAVLEGCKRCGVKKAFDVFYVYHDEPFLRELNAYIEAKDTSKMLTYGEVLDRVIDSNCILELVQKNQDSLTVRAYEAVYYNKKLLTNNRAILDFKYYDPKYMQFFSDPAEIDWEWVKRSEEVDYSYDGDFSALKFIKQIYSDLENEG